VLWGGRTYASDKAKASDTRGVARISITDFRRSPPKLPARKGRSVILCAITSFSAAGAVGQITPAHQTPPETSKAGQVPAPTAKSPQKPASHTLVPVRLRG